MSNAITKYFTIKNIIIVGILIRLLFLKFGAPLYYGTPNYPTCMGDAWAWLGSMQNLVHTGTYTLDHSYEDGKFYRPPGYSFFLMIFYFITGFNVDAMPLLVILTQAILDTFSIYFVYRILKNINAPGLTPIIGATLYCFYPFAIVWTAVMTAECTSIFFLLWSLSYLTREESPSNYFKSGITIGCSILMRVQVVFIIPAIIIYFIIQNKKFALLFKKSIIYYFIAITLSYGLWPIRNLCYGKFIPAEELVNNKHFSKDFMSYLFYIWSVKTDHRPQFDQLIHGEPVQWPKASYLLPGDSAKLDRIARLCYSCGRGFSYWKYSENIINKPITELTPCSEEISATFDELRANQIRHNPYNFFIAVPLSNLKKTLFKSALYDHPNKLIVLMSNILFSYRTICIFLGLLGIYFCYRQKIPSYYFHSIIFNYFWIWYLFLCLVYRNIEMRFLLTNDLLLLLPLAYLINYLIEKSNKSIA